MSPLEEDEPLFLDTETTGIPAPGNEALSVSIIDHTGAVLLNSLVRPVKHKKWPAAQAVNGISPADVLRPDLPTLAELTPAIAQIIAGRHVVIYNAVFDCEILADAFALGPPARISCAMVEFAEYYGDWHDYHQSFTYQPLEKAAKHVLYSSKNRAHESLEDCYRARAVWEFLHWPALQEAVADEKERRADRREVRAFLERLQAKEDIRLTQLNAQWVAANLPWYGPLDKPRWASAEQSADVFCRHLTGYTLRNWQTYGNKLLRLPRYGQGIAKKMPAHLAAGGLSSGGPNAHHFLRPVWRAFTSEPLPANTIQPAAMWLSSQYGDELTLAPLFDLRKLTLGVDYVPYSFEYPLRPGYCSASVLKKDYKLKPKQIAALRPALWRDVEHKYIPSHLLYAIPDTAAPAS